MNKQKLGKETRKNRKSMNQMTSLLDFCNVEKTSNHNDHSEVLLGIFILIMDSQ